MLNIVHKFFTDFLMLAGRARLSSHLLNLNGRVLHDLGYSRDLLLKGISSSPWKLTQAQIFSFGKKMQINDVYNLANRQEKEIQKAIAELKSYTDQELSDLGIARFNIEFVVRNGRPRLDEDPRNLNMKKRQSVAA